MPRKKKSSAPSAKPSSAIVQPPPAAAPALPWDKILFPVIGAMLVALGGYAFWAARERNGLDEIPSKAPVPPLAAPPVGFFDLHPPTNAQLAQTLGYTDPDLALKEARILYERVQGGFLPNAWNERCQRGEYSAALCSAAADYFGPKMGGQANARPKRKRLPALDPQNIPLLQGEAFSDLMSLVADVSWKRAKKLSVVALADTQCPRNFSLALAQEVETYISAEPDAFDLMMKLLGNGTPCLQAADPQTELVSLRTGLFKFSRGQADDALVDFTRALQAQIKREEPRVLYWQWRTAKAVGKAEMAQSALARLRVRWPTSWHRVLAEAAGGENPLAVFEQRPLFPDINLSGDPVFDKRFVWFQLMLRLEGTVPGLARYGQFVEDSLPVEAPPGLVQYFARTVDAVDMHRLQIVSLTGMLQSRPEVFNVSTLKLLFPRPYFDDISKAVDGKLDLALLLGLARQESSFDPSAVSSANAQGLLQVLPSTARGIKRNAKLSNYAHNIQVGAKYFLSLVRTFDGSVEKALASYNAGQGTMRKWEARYAFIPYHADDPQLFVDLIPFRETRDYVSSIMRNAYWYHRLYPDMTASLTSETPTSPVLRKLVMDAPVRTKASARLPAAGAPDPSHSQTP
ncbi:MAG: lytic transglycosylase domain-containing protein [Bdellovibrionales bacterium]|nr:lytic transglycosylase domain-containing protein [Bdellovibrionales bacterium]